LTFLTLKNHPFLTTLKNICMIFQLLIYHSNRGPKFKTDLDKQYKFQRSFFPMQDIRSVSKRELDSRERLDSGYEIISLKDCTEKSNYFGRGCSKINSIVSRKSGNLKSESEEDSDRSNYSSFRFLTRPFTRRRENEEEEAKDE
jgi:hypothetical protein